MAFTNERTKGFVNIQDINFVPYHSRTVKGFVIRKHAKLNFRPNLIGDRFKFVREKEDWIVDTTGYRITGGYALRGREGKRESWVLLAASRRGRHYVDIDLSAFEGSKIRT